jgi:hypothetical protein
MGEDSSLSTLKSTVIENLIGYLKKSIKVLRVYFTKDEPEDCTPIKKVNIPFIDGYFVIEVGYGSFVLWCGYIQI